MKPLFLTCRIFLLSACLSGGVYAQELASLVTLSQVHVNSTAGGYEIEMQAAKRWTFKTSFGKITVPLKGISLIQFAADGASVDVHTVGGDRWVAALPQALIEAVEKADGAYASRPIEGLRFIHKFSETKSRIEASWNFTVAEEGLFSGKLLDGALKVDGGLCPITLPAEQIQKVSVINRELDGLQLRVLLSSGQVYMLKPVQSRIGIMDRFGNTLKLDLEELISFGPKAALKKVEIPTLSQRIRLILDGGAEQAYEIPGSLIPFETDWANLLLSSSEVLEIRRLPGTKEFWLQTVYGDVFTGKIPSKTWHIPSSTAGQAGVQIATRKIDQLLFDNNPIHVKNRQWWHMTDGSRVRGQFKRDSYRLRINKGGESHWETIPTGQVQLLEPAEEGRITIASGNKRYSIRPIASELEMRLDYNGLEYALPWSRLLRVELLENQKLSLMDWMKVLSPELEEEIVEERAREILIEAGSFWMGRQGGFGLEDEQPTHKVNLAAFYMDQHEVTLADFRRFVEAKNYATEAERSGADLDWTKPGFPQEDNEPVVFVSWFDAIAYCNWRSREAGLSECYRRGPKGEWECALTAGGYRLPTEAEWEFVASERGAEKRYPWGESEEITEGIAHANFSQSRSEPFDGFVWTAGVEAFPPNALGIYGLAGNVWEWCEDWYHYDAYFLVHRRKIDNPVVIDGDAPSLSQKVMRGGSFANELDFLRCASRGSGMPIGFAERIGFRCVRGIAASEVQ